MELRLRAVENDASVIEQFYKPKQKKFFKFKFNCNPLTGSQNILITSNFSYTNDPLIFDLMTLKSTQFIGSARCPEFNSNPSVSSNENAYIHNIHDPSLAGIHQSVLEITRSQAVFAYIMTPVTFDL